MLYHYCSNKWMLLVVKCQVVRRDCHSVVYTISSRSWRARLSYLIVARRFAAPLDCYRLRCYSVHHEGRNSALTECSILRIRIAFAWRLSRFAASFTGWKYSMLEWRGKSVLDVDSILSLTQRWQIFEGMEVSWPKGVLCHHAFTPYSTFRSQPMRTTEWNCPKLFVPLKHQKTSVISLPASKDRERVFIWYFHFPCQLSQPGMRSYSTMYVPVHVLWILTHKPLCRSWQVGFTLPGILLEEDHCSSTRLHHNFRIFC